MNWKDSGAPTKSDAEVNRLVKDVLLDPKFKPEDLRGFSVARENQRSDAAEKKSPFLDSFQTADINIEVPSCVKDVPPGTFTVPGLLYRNLTAVIRAVFSSPLASHFHLSPFKLFHKSPSGEEERYSLSSTTQTFSSKNMTMCSVLLSPPMSRIASERRLWLPLCSGPTAPTLRTSVPQSSGRSIYFLGMFRNTFVDSQTRALASTLHTFLLFPIHSKTLPPISAVNAARKKQTS